MEGTSGTNVICLVHTNGQFVTGEDGQLQYVGGRTISRTIKEGTTYDELRRIVCTTLGVDERSINMKFRVCVGDTTTYVDMVDDEGVEHFTNLNRPIGHLYVSECSDTFAQPSREVGGEGENA